MSIQKKLHNEIECTLGYYRVQSFRGKGGGRSDSEIDIVRQKQCSIKNWKSRNKNTEELKIQSSGPKIQKD